MRLCDVNGCEKKHSAKGLCAAHYRRMSIHGDPLSGRTPDGEPLKRFHQILKMQTDSCVRWPFGHSSTGYAAFVFDGRQASVHREVCIQTHGKPHSQKLDAAHACGNEWCVNPLHIRWATKKQNAYDKIVHGTVAAKFTEDQIPEIRLKADEGEPITAIAREYSVAPLTIRRIVDGITWSWVD